MTDLTSPVRQMDLRIGDRFKDLEFRYAFLEMTLVDEIAHLVISTREANGLTQGELAHEAGMLQPAVSRVERAAEANYNIKTLFRIALALDCRIKIEFQPIEEFINEQDARYRPTDGNPA